LEKNEKRYFAVVDGADKVVVDGQESCLFQLSEKVARLTAAPVADCKWKNCSAKRLTTTFNELGKV